MTWPAALPAAAVRVMRSAAGRRALQVMVVVGGLFALGFLCGEQAHAADGAPGTSSAPGPMGPDAPTVSAASANGVEAWLKDAVGRLVAAPAGHGQSADSARPRPSAPEQPNPTGSARPNPQQKPTPKAKAKPASPAAAPPAETVPAGSGAPIGSGTPAEGTVPADGTTPAPGTTPAHDTARVVPVLGAVVEGVVKTVDDAVLRPVGDLVVTVTGGLAEVTAPIPGLPQMPPLPSAPELPGTPSLPGLPGLPSVPGQSRPAPVTQPDGPGHSAATGDAPAQRRTAARGAAYGPRFDEVGSTAHAPARRDGRRAADGAGYVRVPQAPGGDPTGVLGNRSAVDNGTPRHGDAHAVALNQRAPLDLLSGAAARANGDATRDRHRDIPVSPA
ncbi:hypothetical protein ACFV29_00465 [Streptomyces sp. NPDC059690]|uniref:hypothetical protein n=1 Tax=Streptomyces sp. NPDC059690 TaxID=3346907 RepID=UPI00369D2913